MGAFPSTAFVTGATGLLGNHLVRQLLGGGSHVKALVRSRSKAQAQFAGLPVEIVTGDMCNVSGFAQHLRGVDVLFHTAAYFRENYTGGSHRDELSRVNVEGTRDLLSHAYAAGVRRFVHTSSSAVLTGKPGQTIDETMSRPVGEASDYPLSKIQADAEIAAFLESHPDASACMVLPGWMVGPADIGPTASGQLILDFLGRKLPGIPPADFPVVDARDVAQAHVEAARRGRRGERFLVAGRPMDMSELFSILEEVSGIRAPRRHLPISLLYALAVVNEAWHSVSRRPVLISLVGVRLMAQSRGRNHCDSTKAQLELGVHFRPVRETLRDTVDWYRRNGWDHRMKREPKHLRPTEDSI